MMQWESSAEPGSKLVVGSRVLWSLVLVLTQLPQWLSNFCRPEKRFFSNVYLSRGFPEQS